MTAGFRAVVVLLLILVSRGAALAQRAPGDSILVLSPVVVTPTRGSLTGRPLRIRRRRIQRLGRGISQAQRVAPRARARSRSTRGRSGLLGVRELALTAGLERQVSDERRRGYENFEGARLGVRGALRRDQDDRVGSTDEYPIARPLRHRTESAR